uniref:Uncharacterized protein n=1 Tax=Pyxicephalus adspersus TaxID=30357 RepID=A0AAV2ZMF0_PYXAD|nr:TPA: hypothetical protein GDO54_004243 [Pyxicephalus adspersus]
MSNHPKTAEWLLKSFGCCTQLKVWEVHCPQHGKGDVFKTVLQLKEMLTSHCSTLFTGKISPQLLMSGGVTGSNNKRDTSSNTSSYNRKMDYNDSYLPFTHPVTSAVYHVNNKGMLQDMTCSR